MSNDVLKAADDARRFLRGFAAINEVATAFEQAGSVLQAKDEAEKALAELRREVAEQQEVLAAAERDLAAAKQQARDVVAAAKEKAEQTVADATETIAGMKAGVDTYKAEVTVACNAAAKASAKKVDEALAQRLELAAEVKELEARAERARAYIAKLKE